MPDKPSDPDKMPDFPDDAEIRRQLEAMGFGDDEDVKLELAENSAKPVTVNDVAGPLPPEVEALDAHIEELKGKLQDIEDKIADGSQKGVAKADQIDAEFGERMAALKAKVDKRNEAEAERTRQEGRRMASDRSSTKGLGTGLSIAYTIIGLPLLGFGIGWILDRVLDATAWKPICMLVGAVAGIGMAVVMMNRSDPDK